MEKGNYISISDSGAKLSVSVIAFKENDVYTACCPSLDLSGYDHTEEAAKRACEYVLHQWLTEQMESNTLHDDLRQHGWKLRGSTAKEPSLIDTLRGNKSADKTY